MAAKKTHLLSRAPLAACAGATSAAASAARNPDEVTSGLCLCTGVFLLIPRPEVVERFER